MIQREGVGHPGLVDDDQRPETHDIGQRFLVPDRPHQLRQVVGHDPGGAVLQMGPKLVQFVRE